MQNRLPDIPGLRKNFCRARCNFLTYSRSQPRKEQPLCNQGCEKNLNYLTVCETYIGCAMLREKQWNIFDIPTQYTLQLCMHLVCCSLAIVTYLLQGEETLIETRQIKNQDMIHQNKPIYFHSIWTGYSLPG